MRHIQIKIEVLQDDGCADPSIEPAAITVSFETGTSNERMRDEVNELHDAIQKIAGAS